MELDQKIRYALLGFTALSIVLAGIGIHAGHAGIHMKALEAGGRAD